MKEIRIHGRGGQGIVTAGELLAMAAFADGKDSQAFPSFGSERMGSPVHAFVRIDDHKIRTRAPMERPDYVIVQDLTLLDSEDVCRGLKEDGLAVINAEVPAQELKLETRARVVTVPASRIAREKLGRPIPNTALMGAFAAASKQVSLEAIKQGIRNRFPAELVEKNIAAAEAAYRYVEENGKVKGEG